MIIADPNLIDASGHRLHYATFIARLGGSEAQILAHRSFEADGSEVPIRPLFRRRSLDATVGELGARAHLGKVLDRIDPSGRLIWPFLRYAKRALAGHWRDSSVADDLANFLSERHGSAPAAPVELFLASLESDDVRDILERLRADALSTARVNILLLHDPAHNRPASLRLRRALQDPIQTGGPEHRVLSDTPGLVAAWSDVLGIRVTELPVPIFVAPALAEAPPPAPLRITFLGDARAEKGFDLLPGIVAGCEPLWRKGALRFVIHAHSGSRADKSRFDAALAALAAMPPHAVELVRGVLDEPRYTALLRSAGAILAPFDKLAYRHRSSSVVTEGLANAVPAIVPEGTSMAEAVASGCGVTFASPAGIPGAIESLVSNYPSFWQAARLAAPLLRERGSGPRLARALGLGEARPI